MDLRSQTKTLRNQESQGQKGSYASILFEQLQEEAVCIGMG